MTRDGTSERKGSAARRIAVALSYDRDGPDAAPKVVASGHGEVAERILELAFASGVKVREDADLAEILAAVDIDSPIPVEAFRAVAEILTYVYLANRRLPPLSPQGIQP